MRMIWDTRMSNTWFASPSSFPLASIEALTSLECEQGDRIHLRSADLEVAFYQFSLPEALRPFFCLRGVKGRHKVRQMVRTDGYRLQVIRQYPRHDGHRFHLEYPCSHEESHYHHRQWVSLRYAGRSGVRFSDPSRYRVVCF